RAGGDDVHGNVGEVARVPGSAADLGQLGRPRYRQGSCPGDRALGWEVTLTERISTLPLAIRRTLALCLLVAAMLAVWAFAAFPIRWIVTSQDEWRSGARIALAHARGFAARLPQARANVAGLLNRPVWKYFYRVGQGEDASVLIQRDVEAL